MCAVGAAPWWAPTPFGATLLSVIGYIYEEQADLRLGGGKFKRRYMMNGPGPGSQSHRWLDGENRSG